MKKLFAVALCTSAFALPLFAGSPAVAREESSAAKAAKEEKAAKRLAEKAAKEEAARAKAAAKEEARRQKEAEKQKKAAEKADRKAGKTSDEVTEVCDPNGAEEGAGKMAVVGVVINGQADPLQNLYAKCSNERPDPRSVIAKCRVDRATRTTYCGNVTNATVPAGTECKNYRLAGERLCAWKIVRK